MPIISTTKMTADQFLQLNEDPVGVRLELVNGQIAIGPSQTPSHSYTVTKYIGALGGHLLERSTGVLLGDVGIILGRYTVRRPDLIFISNEHADIVGSRAIEGSPDLAIEVIGESSVEVDRVDKFDEYRDAGIAHYWLVDPAMRTFEGWKLENGEYVPTGRAQGVEQISLPPFETLVIPLAKLWRK